MTASAEAAQELSKSGSFESARPVYHYQFPKGARCRFKSVGLVEITAMEEQLAARRAGDDKFGIAQELLKAALYQVDGKPVSLADGSTDTAFHQLSAKARTLLLQAYGQIHNPEPEDERDFFASQKVVV